MHSFGLYLLICLRRNGTQAVEQIYLINLSITELVYNITFLLVLPLQVYQSDYKNYVVGMIYKYRKCIYYCLFLPYICSMIYIVVDRLALVLLSIKYDVYWDEQKAKKLIKGTWVLSVFVGAGLSLAEYFDKFPPIYRIIIYISGDCVFIFLAIVTYSILFYKFVQFQRTPMPQRNRSASDKANHSIFKLFYKSRFFYLRYL